MPLSLFKRGSVYWVRGTFNRVRIRETTGFERKEPAEAYRRRRELELADPAHYAANKATVASAAESFLTELAHTAKSQGTVRFYDVKVRHVVAGLGAIRLRDLTHALVLEYAKRRRADGAHPYSLSREMTALRRILKSAARAGQFFGDITAIIPELPVGYIPQTDWRTPDEVWKVIRKLPAHRAGAVAFIAATAADYSSAFAARPEDVRAKSVLVRGTKTSARLREVPRVGLFDEFLRYAVECASDGETMFPAWPNMHRDMRAACRAVGVPEFTARTLRRSAATWMVRAGVPFEVARKFLGHGSIAMLVKVYGQLDTEATGALIEARMSVSAACPTEPKRAETAEAEDSRNVGKTGRNGGENDDA